MSNRYLISSEINGVETYYTADSNGIITSIGTTMDFTKGFTYDILLQISEAYNSLTNGKVWVDNTNIGSAVEETDGSGSIISTDATAINTKGYSGITSITPTCTGDVKFAFSFNGNTSFKTRGTENVISTEKLIPSTNRSSVVTINSAYDNLFDNNESTSYDSSAILNEIPLEFLTARTIRKFSGKLNTTCILPVTITLQAYDNTNSIYTDLATINVAASDKYFSQEFDNSTFNTNTKFQFKIQYTDDGSGNSLSISELNLYEQVTKEIWITCNKDQVKNIGLTSTQVSELTSTTIADIFNNKTQLDYYIYLPAGSTFTNFVVSFPANSAPIVSEFTATPGSDVHAQDVNIGFKITDLEGLTSTYSIKVNNVEVVSTTPSPESGYVSNTLITNDKFNVGSNTVTIIGTDELGASQSYNFTVTKVDNLPTYVGTLVGRNYTFSVADIDGDKVKFKSTLNGEVLETESELTTVPFNHTTYMENIIISQNNTLVITLTDAVGGVTTITVEFIGEYYGLMFADASNNYLTTDLGELLQYLDFGPVNSGYDSLPLEVQVINKTNAAITSLVINGPKDLNGTDITTTNTEGVVTTTHTEGNVYARLCADDSFETPLDVLPIKDLNPSEKVSFYMKIISTNKNAEGDFIFTTTGVGKLNN